LKSTVSLYSVGGPCFSIGHHPKFAGRLFFSVQAVDPRTLRFGENIRLA